MRRVRLITALALALGMAAGLTLAACGGDSSPEQPIDLLTETQADESLSKADFIQEADGYCAEANSAIATYIEQGEGFTGAGEIADLRQSALEQIRALRAPEQDRAVLNQFLTAFEGQVEAGNKIGLALGREEETTQFESELASAQGSAQEAATQYGFEDCGSEVTADDATTAPGDGSAAPVTPAPAPAPAPAPDTGGSGTGDGGDTGGGGTGGGVGVP